MFCSAVHNWGSLKWIRVSVWVFPGDTQQRDVGHRVHAKNTLHWRHNGRDSVSHRQPYYCLLNRLFSRRSKKTSKLLVTGLCVGNSPGTSEFPAQMTSNVENVSIWWRHHEGSNERLYQHFFLISSLTLHRFFNKSCITEDVKWW